MTITYIGAGTAATAVNASVTPVAHANTAVGDLVLVFASIRNSGTGTVDTPAGWSLITGSANFAVLGHFWETGDVIPAITFTGGVANADTIGQTITFRGVEPRLNDAVGAAISQLNASAQNVDYPALAVPGGNHAVVICMWKQDDNTGVTTPAGFTAVASTTTTTGDDASQAVRYQIQTTDTDITAGTLTVSGGAAAISRSAVIALRPAAAFAVQEQDTWPASVLATVTGVQHGIDQVTVVRQVAGVDTVLRGGESADPIQDTSFVVLDAELPFGVPVRYAAIVNGGVRYDTDAVTYTLVGGKVALTDAITGLAVESTILAWDSKQLDRAATVYRVGDRNIVVSGDLGQFQAALTLYQETDTANAQLKELLANATEATIQIRQPGGYADVDCYVVVLAAAPTRFSQDGSDPRRTWVLQVAEVDGWAPALEAQGFTLQDIYDFYASAGTLADLADDHATLLAVAQADWS